MTDKFQNKFKITSARLQKWDYGWDAAYFVTICTQDKYHFFGEVSKNKMDLSKVGNLAQKYWDEIPQQFPFAGLGEFVVMPNHIHGIVVIDKLRHNFNGESESSIISDNRTPGVGGITGEKNPMLHQNLSRIIRWYKGRMTFESRKIKSNFAWQSRFHEHIIRNAKSFESISEYIITNPQRWDEE